MALTTNYLNLGARPSSGKGSGMKDWSTRAKHRQGTLRKAEQIIWTSGDTGFAHRIGKVTCIRTGIDGKVYGMFNGGRVKRVQRDVWAAA